MPKINSHNPVATSGPVVSLDRFSAVSELPILLRIATPTDFNEAGPVYPTDAEGARTTASWLDSAADSLLIGQEAVGFLLSTVGRDEAESNGKEFASLGEVLNLLAVMVKAAHGGADGLNGYADRLEAGGQK